MEKLANGYANGSAANGMDDGLTHDQILQLNLDLKNSKDNEKSNKYHGDQLIGDKVVARTGVLDDVKHILTLKNIPMINRVLKGLATGKGIDKIGMSNLVGSMDNNSANRLKFIEMQVKDKYNRMLHPPLTYLGDAFKYRQADGKYNSVLSPHLGQAGAPYAKTVPSITHPLGALPDPGDLFDKLLARQEGGRESHSGLSSMLIYHATLIIHDIFRTNTKDKNISDSSSYLDLSPLYGFTEEMQRKIRDNKYKLGLLKPDTFAEDRLLRQPPGVCIMLVMYNRYHNYAATQLRRINENGRFEVPELYQGTKLSAQARRFYPREHQDSKFKNDLDAYDKIWQKYQAEDPCKPASHEATRKFEASETYAEFKKWDEKLRRDYLKESPMNSHEHKVFSEQYDAAWNKLDDDLFNTARLITSGMYIQIAIHDYLRALMGFHQFNTNFTLDPRLEIDHRNVSRGIGNQVTVEFNLLYRFHCAISLKDEQYVEEFIKESFAPLLKPGETLDPKDIPLEKFIGATKLMQKAETGHPIEPWDQTFGIKKNTSDKNSTEKVSDPKKSRHFCRDVNGMFNDEQMIEELKSAMDDPISNFGPRNVPKSLRAVEIMGIMQARKWEIGTLNDFREFFQMKRHTTFESITKNVEIQNALRDLYDHPDKVELYPGIFCESDKDMNLDPGPSELDSALWVAIFSDAITLVRSDRFYTVDWNTNSLTSWGMKEVTADNDICKSSVFHRLLQRAFPGWFPYDSVRFFHPFYTSQTNAKYAQAQGYGEDFRVPPATRDAWDNPKFDTSAADPKKPLKPEYITDAAKISAILGSPYEFVHPAFKDLANFPTVMQNAVREMHYQAKAQDLRPERKDEFYEDPVLIRDYFTDLMRSIVKREAITMGNHTYQIDITRDYAIPVTTKAVADFLGFGYLIRNTDNPKGKYSENEIYQHITNCQVFMSYNADETKLFKRRKAFRESLQVLYDLTINGDIYGYKIPRMLSRAYSLNPMTKLGLEISKRLQHPGRSGATCASLLVLIGLHSAYNTVLAFTSVLNKFITELHDYANTSPEPATPPIWFKVQELAFSTEDKDFQELQHLLLETERKTVRLPVLRTYIKPPVKAEADKTSTKAGVTSKVAEIEANGSGFAEGKLIILDIAAANQKIADAGVNTQSTGPHFLDHRSNPLDHFAGYDTKQLAAISVSAMIKVVAQMRNPRRGHDAQGRLKKVRLDRFNEGYSEFLAPMRMRKIAHLAEQKVAGYSDVYDKDLLKPATDTYLTPEWDEMVPFPNTWKLRFNGFGRSDYRATDNPANTNKCGMLTEKKIDPVALAAPPFYQPQGASTFGGSFAVVTADIPTKLSNETEKMTGGKTQTPADLAMSFSNGCKITAA